MAAVDEVANDANAQNLLPAETPPAAAAAAAAGSIGLYKRRWLMLLLFSTVSMANAYQWIHLNILFDVLQQFYKDSLPASQLWASVAIDCLAMSYSVAYVVLLLPASWLLESRGLRATVLVGSALNCAGAGVKCLAADPASFWLLTAGQWLCAAAQNFLLAVPAQLAAVWFPLPQLSTATALGVFGNQLGVAAGFLLPPLLLRPADTETVRHRLLLLLAAGAAASALLLLLVLLLFQHEPPLPPSVGQLTFRTAHRRPDKDASSYRRELTALAEDC